jgi:hypothetical protein
MPAIPRPNAAPCCNFLRGVTGNLDGSLDWGTTGNSLVRADALVRLFAVEEVGNEFDDTRWRVEPSTTTILWMLDSSILESQRTFSTGSSATEQILAKLFETSTSERYRSRYPPKRESISMEV